MRRFVECFCLVLLLLVSGPPSVAKVSQQVIVGKASVVDGDTIEVGGQRIRLFGIDAPESSQLCKDASGADYRCGQLAANFLAEYLGDNVVTCAPNTKDRYGRIVAACELANRDVQSHMVQNGWAMAYRRYSWRYIREEIRARGSRVGVWRGTMQPPWEWRIDRISVH